MTHCLLLRFREPAHGFCMQLILNATVLKIDKFLPHFKTNILMPHASPQQCLLHHSELIRSMACWLPIEFEIFLLSILYLICDKFITRHRAKNYGARYYVICMKVRTHLSHAGISSTVINVWFDVSLSEMSRDTRRHRALFYPRNGRRRDLVNTEIALHETRRCRCPIRYWKSFHRVWIYIVDIIDTAAKWMRDKRGGAGETRKSRLM